MKVIVFLRQWRSITIKRREELIVYIANDLKRTSMHKDFVRDTLDFNDKIFGIIDKRIKLLEESFCE